MIKEIRGNLLEAKAEALVNAVNCVGVMGKGIALQFCQMFSEDYFRDYKRACQNGDLKIGKVHVYDIAKTRPLPQAVLPRFIINFPTKNHCREKSRIEYVESGLQSLVQTVKTHEIESIAMPALGCGLGGLDWGEVKPLIEKAFVPISNTELLLFPPN